MMNYQFSLYKGEEDLPKGELPKEAYKFREPNSLAMVNVIAALYAIPLVFIIHFIARQRGLGIVSGIQGQIGVLLSLLMIMPHEFLHAVCFPKSAKKHIVFAPKTLLFAVFCTAPITKARFIFLSLLPNLVFGIIPFIVWALLPASFPYSQLLLSFASLNIFCGCGDYMNIVNAAFQMPKHSMQQLSGLHSYWFLPEDVK